MKHLWKRDSRLLPADVCSKKLFRTYRLAKGMGKRAERLPGPRCGIPIDESIDTTLMEVIRQLGTKEVPERSASKDESKTLHAVLDTLKKSKDSPSPLLNPPVEASQDNTDTLLEVIHTIRKTQSQSPATSPLAPRIPFSKEQDDRLTAADLEISALKLQLQEAQNKANEVLSLKAENESLRHYQDRYQEKLKDSMRLREEMQTIIEQNGALQVQIANAAVTASEEAVKEHEALEAAAEESSQKSAEIASLMAGNKKLSDLWKAESKDKIEAERKVVNLTKQLETSVPFDKLPDCQSSAGVIKEVKAQAADYKRQLQHVTEELENVRSTYARHRTRTEENDREMNDERFKLQKKISTINAERSSETCAYEARLKDCQKEMQLEKDNAAKMRSKYQQLINRLKGIVHCPEAELREELRKAEAQIDSKIQMFTPPAVASRRSFGSNDESAAPLSEQFADSQAECAKLKEQRNKLQQENGALTRSITALRSEQRNSRGSWGEWDEKTESLRQELLESKAENTKLSAQIRTYIGDAERQNQAIKNLRLSPRPASPTSPTKSETLLKNKCRQLEQASEKLTNTVTALRKEKDSAVTSSVNMRTERDKCTKTITELHLEMLNRGKDWERERAALAKTIAEQRDQSLDASKLRAVIADLKNEVQREKTQCKNAEQDKAEAVKKHTLLTLEVERLKRQTKGLQGQKEDIEEKLTEIRAIHAAVVRSSSPEMCTPSNTEVERLRKIAEDHGEEARVNRENILLLEERIKSMERKNTALADELASAKAVNEQNKSQDPQTQRKSGELTYSQATEATQGLLTQAPAMGQDFEKLMTELEQERAEKEEAEVMLKEMVADLKMKNAEFDALKEQNDVYVKELASSRVRLAAAETYEKQLMISIGDYEERRSMSHRSLREGEPDANIPRCSVGHTPVKTPQLSLFSNNTPYTGSTMPPPPPSVFKNRLSDNAPTPKDVVSSSNSRSPSSSSSSSSSTSTSVGKSLKRKRCQDEIESLRLARWSPSEDKKLRRFVKANLPKCWDKESQDEMFEKAASIVGRDKHVVENYVWANKETMCGNATTPSRPRRTLTQEEKDAFEKAAEATKDIKDTEILSQAHEVLSELTGKSVSRAKEILRSYK